MNNRLCDMLGVDFPLVAFSHCRDVVAAVSRAGGFGVLGVSSFTPGHLEEELSWIDAHVSGRPYGVDVLIPENQPLLSAETTAAELAARVPARHRDFVVDLLGRHGIAVDRDAAVDASVLPITAPETAERLMDVAFRHPIRLIANALGIAPPSMLARGRQAGVKVAALVGAKEHALRQMQVGVDILVAQGGEAGGHCGEVSTLVLVPEILRVAGDVPVLAAGGIMTGRQMAACMAMGAQGVWTGSVWLATTESETSQIFRDKMVAASSRDTIRAKSRTGKPSRQLRSAWHDAWEVPDSPGALPMPLMGMISQPAFAKIDRAAEAGNPGAKAMVSYFVGQGVGLIDQVQSAAAVVQNFKEDFAVALTNLTEMIEAP